MLFWEKSAVSNAPLIDKPLDQSRLPSRFAQGRDLFAEPDSEDEALGLLELEDNRNAGIRAPELNPVDHSQTGLGSLSTIKKDFSGRQHGDLPDLDLDHHLQYHTDARGDVRYYTQAILKPGSGFSVLDVEDGYGKGYRNATRFINSSAGAGHAGFAIKLNASGRISNTMLGSGSGFVADAFKTFDCPQGTDPVADGLADTLQFLEGSNLISITGDSSADSVTFDVVEANIDHDALTNFVANEHIDHSAVSVIAGTGLSGGGTIVADRTLNLSANLDDLLDVQVVNPLTGHFLIFNSLLELYESVLVQGDLQLSASGVWTINVNAVTYDRIQNVSSDKLLGSIAGGTVEEIALTAAGRALLDDADAAAQRTTMGAAAASHTHTEADITDLDHTDATAVHDNVSGEIAAITEKPSPVDADLLLIEDSADSNNKKFIQLGNLPGGGGGGDVSAASNLTDNAIVRGDGGAKGVQTSGVLINDNNNVTIPDLGKLSINPGGNSTNVFAAQVKHASDTVVLASTWKGGRASGVGGAGFGIRHLVKLENAAGALHDAAKVEHVWDDPTDTSEDCRTDFSVMVAGAFVKKLTIDSSGVTIITPTIASFANATHDHEDAAGGGDLIAYLLTDGSRTLGAEWNAGAHTIGFTVQTATGDGTTTIDWRLGNKFNFTFGAQDDTFTFTAPTKPCNLILKLIQDASATPRLATWPATVKWADGTSPTLSGGDSEVDIIAFYFDGTNYHGTALINSS